MVGAGVFGIFPFLPLYATSVHKLSTLVSGMILTPRSIGVISASAITSFLLKRWGYRWPMILGLSIISLSTILLGGPGLQAIGPFLGDRRFLQGPGDELLHRGDQGPGNRHTDDNGHHADNETAAQFLQVLQK